MDTNGPDAAQSLQLKILEIDLRAAERRADQYRNLLLSLGGEGAAGTATPSLRRPASQRPQPRATPQPSSSTVRDPGAWLAPAPAPALAPALASSSSSAPFSALASASAPARPERLIRATRREVVVEIPSIVTRQPTRDQSPTRFQLAAPISRNEGLGDTSSHISTISTNSIHENEATDDGPDTIQAILEGADLAPYTLSWGENERANKTPKIARSALSNCFRLGRPEVSSEWLKCNLGEESFFIAEPRAQPFAPTAIGHQGLVLVLPGWIQDLHNKEGFLFHVFLSESPAKGNALLKYLGDYTKVPLLRNTIQWSLIPAKCQRIWLKRMSSSRSKAARTLHVRIKLRDMLKREPSIDEVESRLHDRRRHDEIRHADLHAAFISGEEKMQVMGIKCERYDSHLASIVLENGVEE